MSVPTGYSAWQIRLHWLVAVLFALWRLVLRASRGAPAAPGNGPAWSDRVAGFTHLGLYGLMLILPISGIVAWFGGVIEAGEVHEVLTNVALGLIGLHVAGALWHQFRLKDGLMRRMWRPQA